MTSLLLKKKHLPAVHTIFCLLGLKFLVCSAVEIEMFAQSVVQTI